MDTLAIVTALEGMVGAAIGRTEIAGALSLANQDHPLGPAEMGLAYLEGSRIVGVAEIVGLQFAAALIVLYAVARYRIGSKPQTTRTSA